jgi:cell wall-associated NlpC family hydrolase
MNSWDLPRDTIVLKDIPVSTFETPVADSSERIGQKSGGTVAINTGKITPSELIAFAQTQVGIPYKYASIDPKLGFDCSGFVTYVFNHFNIAVPRSSVDFTHRGNEIGRAAARPGDLILFTGTDSTIRVVGHMGIVLSNKDGELLFIHSSSGKANGVVITPLESYYLSRFVKVIRIFPE